ncbi:Alpha,alpha-trehalose-phosphate synthase [UDP-forming] [Roseivivax jejudonensis]|uniref:Alpha,alpha-trehalose-phosphate synthase [UDP-forming] n=1 Tax=Roseivivax jejudonensis TaxID=1529041 RepID=A0A1X6Y6M7_9RHOB|nr:trehalose-6-phosphate synthase [Roseivivax jejudonensis]SLN12465.1 Alpha,alpha-trehalose-phosphate synthase [UDP-forming] [Roseivivax jejudonensis]
MSGKLVVVSNRIPTDAAPSGGLVVAVHDALEQSGGLWVGAHPERGGPTDDGLTEIARDSYTRLAFHLSEEEYDNYYLGFSNSVLWPICHGRIDLVEIERCHEATYLAVNRRVARLLAQHIEDDDLVWIHDYHFLPLAQELRRLGVRARIGFFLHIPFPQLSALSTLPTPDDFARWLAAFDLVGLQTRRDTARCLEMFRADPRAEFMPDGTVKFHDRVLAVRSFPIGIEVDGFAAAARAQQDAADLGSDLGDRLVIGVDRLDYSKGLPNRFRAFGAFLGARAPEDPRASLLQIAPPTRERVAAYRAIRTELEEIAGRLNGEFATLDWTPIRYIHHAVERDLLAGLYRRSAACLVTSLADGMNLVAKEYVAAQDPDDPGVLILSRFAGAAEDMTDAILVNPYDITEMADAISTALAMPRDERRARHEACLAAVRDSDVAVWADRFVACLRACPPTLMVGGPGDRAGNLLPYTKHAEPEIQ